MIDMHVHSTISDGMETPKEIVNKAMKMGLKAVALTDHDCIDGLDEASDEARRIGMHFIPGIELSVCYEKGRILHILGLGIDYKNKRFLELYHAYRQSRNAKVDYVINGINERFGLDIQKEALKAFSTDGYLDRQCVAKWLFFNNHTSMMKYAWIDYIDYFDYQEGELATIELALDMIKSAGGKAFLAHYHKPLGLKGLSGKKTKEVLERLKKLGLDGFEAYYPDFEAEDYLKVNQYINHYDFLACGGSDYHGSNRPTVEMAIGQGDMRVPDHLLSNLC